ncbi:hypothetical protein F1880_006739 [Penicillium rolfsii]|nr:hypothetical protein F1880_006739 [Penicillium rolfsii]
MTPPKRSASSGGDRELKIYLPRVGVENVERYGKHGYHPVDIDDILNERYRVVHKLGFGTYGIIWLALDQISGEYVAIKIGVATESNPIEAFLIDELQRSSSLDVNIVRSVIPRVLDNFVIKGPNGKHHCYVSAVGGANLSQAKEKANPGVFHLAVSRAMAAQLVTAIAHLHERRIVHGDLNLQNMVLRLPLDSSELPVEALYEKFGKPWRAPVVRADGKKLTIGVPSHTIKSVWLGKACNEITLSDAKIMLIDYGESYIPDLQARHNSMAPHAYRPPEALWDKEKHISFPSDIWTLACALWDLFAWYPLFKSYSSKEKSITAEQVAVLGKLPPGWWSDWGRKNEVRRRQFDRNGKTKHPELFPDMETRFEEYVQLPRRDGDMEIMEDEEKEAFLKMLRSMLVFIPQQRATAKQVLESEWMVRWAIPEYDKMRGRKNVRFA